MSETGMSSETILDMTVGVGAGWWLTRLYTELMSPDTQGYLALMNNYNNGQHRLPEGHKRMRAAFRALQRYARANYTGLVANSVLERLEVTGFSTGADAAQSQDKKAWQIWQANRLDVNSTLVHGAALVFSRSYVIVGPNKKDPTTPLITAEDPRQVISALDPSDRTTVLAALKVYDDDIFNLRHAVLFLPAKVYYFQATLPKTKDVRELLREPEMVFDDDDPTSMITDETGSVPNPLGEVPVVAFVNRPQLDGTGIGEFEDVIDVQDRINNAILDRLVISKMQAYRQRWMSGVSMKDENGNPLTPLQPGADLVWSVEDDKAKFGDFDQTDLTPVLKATSADVTDLAAISRTPPHYLLGAIVNISGDALQAAEAGLVSKCRDRIRSYSDSWESVMRLAFKLINIDLPPDTQTQWSDPALYTLTSRGDAAIKFSAAGVPWSYAMRVLNYTPQEIEKMRQEKIQDALLTALQPAGQNGPGGGGMQQGPVNPLEEQPASEQMLQAEKGNPI